MIKAIYLESFPDMDNVGALEILSELNPLTRDEKESTVLIGRDHKIARDVFITPNYKVTFLKISGDRLTLGSMKKTYEILQLGIPGFLKVMSIGETLIIAYPRYSDVYENANYNFMMEELIRFTSYAYRKTGGDDISTSIMLKEYVEMCVSYPGNRSNAYKHND